jgi:hypothetical protein
MLEVLELLDGIGDLFIGFVDSILGEDPKPRNILIPPSGEIVQSSEFRQQIVQPDGSPVPRIK